MEPITVMAGTVVGYLAKQLADNKSFKEFAAEFSDAAIKWIKPLFLKEDQTPKDVLSDLQNQPASEAKQHLAREVIKADLMDNKDALALLQEMAAVIDAKKVAGEQVSIVISGSENFIVNSPITGNVYFGGSGKKDGEG